MHLDVTECVEDIVAINYWFDHHINAYLKAVFEGRNWQEAVAAAEIEIGDGPRTVLTQADLKSKKGLRYSRQHIGRLHKAGRFPAPFQLPAPVSETS